MENNQISNLKNVTEYQDDTYIKLNNVLVKARLIVLIIIGLILLALGVLMVIFRFAITIGYIYIAVSVIIPLVSILRLKSLIKKSIEHNRKINGKATLSYTFYSEYVEIKAMTDNGESNSKMEYSKYKKIVETKDYIFMFLNDNQAHCVLKSSFEEGSYLDARELLMSHCKIYKLKCSKGKI